MDNVIKNEIGGTILEYCFLASLIFLMGVVGVGIMGEATKEKFNESAIKSGFSME